VVELIVADSVQPYRRARGVTMKKSAEPTGRSSVNGEGKALAGSTCLLTKVSRTKPQPFGSLLMHRTSLQANSCAIEK
jgi:hypothetical protein